MKITERDKIHVNDLFAIAQELEPVGGAKVAAAIVYKNRVFIGRNSLKTHPFSLRYRKNNDAVPLHAEHDAMIKAIRELSNWEIERSTLYVVRVKRPEPRSKLWIPGLARPCRGCGYMAAQFNLKRVVYTTDEGTLECL